MNRPDPIDIPRDVVAARREAALESLEGAVMVLPAAPLQYASRDGEYPYHPDRELYYLTGATEPETVAVLVGGSEPRFVLFVRDRDEEAELWSGKRLGVNGARERFSPDECHPVADLDEALPKLLREGDRVFLRLGRSDRVERHVLEALAWARGRGARTGTGPRAVVDPGEVLDELRLRKDDYELQLLRRAAEISCDGHRAAARAIAPGVGEWAVEAALDGAFRAAGAAGPGYQSIVGSGRNGCVLHYVSNRDVIGDEDLVLVDAGAEYGLYHGDVTRTYPASGRFTGPRRDVYQVVEDARAAAVEAIVPGAAVDDVHHAAASTLAEGLIALGVLSGDPESLVAEEAHKPYFPHRTSHWLGLDVHDVGDYARNGKSRALEPGMVLTVEPGLYFRPGVSSTSGFSGIGVRIEDDVLVTEDGNEVLTAGVPSDLHEVEALVGVA